MKYEKLGGMIAFLIIMVPLLSGAQTYNLKFEEISANAVSLELEVYISGSSSFKIGSSNLVFDYDQTIIDNPVLLSDELSANYSVEAENKADEKVDFNLVYTDFSNPSNADDIVASPSWTKLGTVQFTVISPGSTAELDWLEAARSETVVYDSDGNRLEQGTAIDGILSSPLLPVELISFEAQAKGTDVQLEWSSASEINLKGYAIERSIDSDHFEEIAFRSGLGNPLVTTSYTTLDTDVPMLNTLYYRLRMVDLDGSFEYSEVRAVLLDWPLISELSLFPNPSKGITQIAFFSNKNGKALISIANMEGKVFQNQTIKIADGQNNIPYSFESLANGSYHLLIEMDGEQWSTPLLISK